MLYFQRALKMGAGQFRWNRYLGQWEGKVEFTEAKKTVEQAGGAISIVKAEES